VVTRCRIERGVVGVSGPDHRGRSCDHKRVHIAVIEEDTVADLDRIAQSIPRLIISDSVPERRLVLVPRQIVDRIGVGFGLEQPVTA
jgi:hypothetical protein